MTDHVEKCETKGCTNQAARIVNIENKYAMICDYCWHKIYKK